MSEPAPKVNYQELKDWIAALEQHEAVTGKPAMITVAQSRALAELSKAAQGPNPLTVNVGIDDDGRDFFGMINHFVNVSGAKVTFEETCVLPPNQLFISTATVQLANRPSPIVIPSATTGGLINGQNPSYTRKKDARKYAAKCVVEWLTENGHIAAQPPNKKRKGPTPPVQQISGGSNLTAQQIAASAASSSQRTVFIKKESSSSEEEISGQSNVQELLALCKTLGMNPPKMHTIAIGGEGSGLWGGRMEFDRKDDVPESVGSVNKIVGKKLCKETMAARALKYLREEERRREALLKALEDMVAD